MTLEVKFTIEDDPENIAVEISAHYQGSTENEMRMGELIAGAFGVMMEDIKDKNRPPFVIAIRSEIMEMGAKLLLSSKATISDKFWSGE